ncbi:sigma-E processing peptidase SpoIIGA [[Eubacterium] siraeum DSM 15702]|uniref:Sigma-E processing peptidase SpoIIGA n=1 Tax=[Eubacterium] siraeum DSM 15702 TaxID=428128 RepID=B0MLT1_9FIRM|nr:sigma-E processing peptidase SpoIIGA [[Eubacterium] siraeum DSM 15702]UWP26235.1 sigma-E processing peptidase SpoIIGA [[Eubacterium] siraeum]
MVIYLDVLILINLYVTYFQILAVSVFTHRKTVWYRKLSAAGIGAVASLSIFIPQEMVLTLTLLKIFLCALIAFVAFGYTGFRAYAVSVLFLMLVSFVFSGLMLCVWLFAAPMKMLFINGTVYFGVDTMTIILSTCAAYGVVRIIRYILDKNGKTDGKYTVIIKNNGRECRLSALADSGNGIVDCFSGLPVIVCRRDMCADVSPPAIEMIENNSDISEIGTQMIKGVRIMPFSTVGKGGLICMFKAESVVIDDETNEEKYPVNALIGIVIGGRQEYEAIFNPKILV